MAQAYKIEIDIGVAQAIQGIRQVAQAVQQLNGIRVAAGVSASAGRAASAPSQAQVIRQQAQLLNAQAQHMRAQLNLQRASNAGQQSGFMQRLGTFARSTRYGQGGFMPLLGRSLDLVGAKSGGAAVAVMAAVTIFQAGAAAVRLFTDAVRGAAETLSNLNAARMIGGGTAGQAALLNAIGIGDIAGAASGFRQNLLSNPMAMAAGMRAGIGPQIGRPFGSQNEAQMLQQAVEYLRSIGQGEQQLREARILGLEALLPLINVSRQMAQLQREDAAVRKGILEQFGPQANELNAALARLRENFFGALEALVGPAMPQIIRVVNAIATALRDLARVLSTNQWIGRALGDLAVGVSRFIAGLLDAINFARDPAGFLKDVSKGTTISNLWEGYLKASSANTTALGANTNAMGTLAGVFKSGQYGGGVRAGGSIPQGLRGYALMRAQQGGSLRLGAFSI